MNYQYLKICGVGMRENSGAYDQSSFDEDRGNVFLQSLLQSENTIKTYFAGRDKAPNLDGYFELLTPSGEKGLYTPVGKIEVQIKTMQRNYVNNNKRGRKSRYKYSCDTKVINAASKQITHNPIFVLLVDVVNMRGFYIHISDELLLELGAVGKNATLYFDDDDEITKETLAAFHLKAKEIYDSYARKAHSGEANMITASNRLNPEDTKKLQHAVDRFNGLMDNEFSFIKTSLFPDAWKFGLAYTFANDGIMVGIYIIRQGENGIFIKEFNFADDTSSIFVTLVKNADINYVDTIVDDSIERIEKNFFEKGMIDVQYLPTEVLEEVVFSFLDEVSRYNKFLQKKNYPCVYFCDDMAVLDVENVWKLLIKLSCEFVEKYGLVRDGKVRIDPLSIFNTDIGKGSMDFARNRLSELFQSKESFQEPQFLCIFAGRFPYRMLQSAIRELKYRNVGKVVRPWKHKDYENFMQDIEHLAGYQRYETGFRISDYTDNVLKLFTVLPGYYDSVSKKLLGRYHEEMRLKRHYHIGVKADGSFGYFYVSHPATDFSLNAEITEVADVNSYKSDYENIDEYGSGGIGGLFQSCTPLYDCIVYLLRKSISKHLGFHSPRR
ncbi:hypothetical protein LJC74_06665 [Eubacteriales bacterium OttesenSCG-928-A19]|nr:hypothetical protein [Eubacteriales bacterium OttesenSCG-928-A19]